MTSISSLHQKTQTVMMTAQKIEHILNKLRTLKKIILIGNECQKKREIYFDTSGGTSENYSSKFSLLLFVYFSVILTTSNEKNQLR